MMTNVKSLLGKYLEGPEYGYTESNCCGTLGQVHHRKSVFQQLLFNFHLSMFLDEGYLSPLK